MAGWRGCQHADLNFVKFLPRAAVLSRFAPIVRAPGTARHTNHRGARREKKHARMPRGRSTPGKNITHLTNCARLVICAAVGVLLRASHTYGGCGWTVHRPAQTRTMRSALQTGACTRMRSIPDGQPAARSRSAFRRLSPSSAWRLLASLTRQALRAKGRVGGPLSRSPASRSHNGTRAKPVAPGPRLPHVLRCFHTRRKPAFASGQ